MEITTLKRVWLFDRNDNKPSSTRIKKIDNREYLSKDFQNKNRAAILAELKQEKKKLIMQNQSAMNNPGASIPLSRPAFAKDFRDHAEQQHIAAQQKAALQHAHAHSSGYFITQDSAFGNLILPVLPRLDPE
ncbi:SOSS complex subunit C isoform X1 [Stegostoma tigrinum]|uniref:SOSS complex subunit C isoform X1 n=1 Tax=Stegostoma tigrinum TaxID=3053191 RepID=UPI0028707D65|nr:SOSS complex subunit C isoform X1 [Stegostoma tigrinum]